jgi:hypothetical protein
VIVLLLLTVHRNPHVRYAGHGQAPSRGLSSLSAQVTWVCFRLCRLSPSPLEARFRLATSHCPLVGRSLKVPPVLETAARGAYSAAYSDSGVPGVCGLGGGGPPPPARITDITTDGPCLTPPILPKD